MGTTIDARRIERASAWVAQDLGGHVPTITIDADLSKAIVDIGRDLERRHVCVDDATPVVFADLPASPLLASIGRELDEGRGLVVARGFPVDQLSEAAAGLVFWGLGVRLGEPLPQNRHGDRLYLVRDERKLGYEGVRGSKTNGALIFHTDAASGYANSVPNTFGLLAIRTAWRGGASLAVSGHTVYNRLLAHHADVISTLREPFCWDRSEEARPGEDPIFRAPILERDGADLFVRYNLAWLGRGHELAGEPLTGEQRRAIDAFETVLSDRDLVLRFELAAGDALFVNNTAVLHNREAFDDGDDGPGRLLYRLWLQR